MDAYKLDESPAWQNRIVGHDMVDPESLLANPHNFRIHTKLQQDVIAGLISEVGWVKSTIVNVTSGHILDGHARVTLAIRKGEKAIPVEYVELNEDEEALALALLDETVGMAGIDGEKLAALVKSVPEGIDDALRELLAQMRAANTLPTNWPEYDESAADDVEYLECPECGHNWPK